MSRSPHTFELWATAHTSGDEYYRHLTNSLSNGGRYDDRCASLANSYLIALKDLEKQLETVEDTDDAADLKASTAKFIELVRADLKRFELTPASEINSSPINIRDEALVN